MFSGRIFTVSGLIAAFAATCGLVSSFSVPPSDRTFSKTKLSVSFSGAADGGAMEDHHHQHHPNRLTEFSELEPIEHSLERQTRMRLDQQNRNQFAKFGDELWGLRQSMTHLSEKLLLAINNGIRESEEKIRESLREMEEQDPELVYKMEIENLNRAKAEGRTADVEIHTQNALAARSCLPHFNLEGLWVGK